MILVSALLLLLLSSVASYSWLFFLLRQNSSILVPDTPNIRSLHSQVVPKGGGLVIIVSTASLIGIYLAMYQSVAVMHVLIALGVGCIATLGWFDDRHNLRIRTRFIAQIVIACAMVYLLMLLVRFQGINIVGYCFESPDWLLFVALVVWVVWMTNLFNFMDGIDGIAAVETLIIACGLALLFASTALIGLDSWLPVALFSAALGFLWWNWYPAKVFLGLA